MTLRADLGRRGPAVVVMAAGAVVTIVGTLLPWVRTGGVQRNSYDVFVLVERLGISESDLVGYGLRRWPLVPLLVVAAVVLAWWGWPHAGAVIGIVGGVYAGGVGATVATADAVQVVDIKAGATVTAVGAAVLLLGSITALVVGWRAPSPI